MEVDLIWDWNGFKDTLELEAELVWNRNGFKDTLVSCAELIQRHFWNWKRNQFGIEMGLKTTWLLELFLIKW